jgi:hypothetical protein
MTDRSGYSRNLLTITSPEGRVKLYLALPFFWFFDDDWIEIRATNGLAATDGVEENPPRQKSTKVFKKGTLGPDCKNLGFPWG